MSRSQVRRLCLAGLRASAIACILAVGTFLFAQPASAMPPTPSDAAWHDPPMQFDLCPMYLQKDQPYVDSSAQIRQTQFFNSSGNVVRIAIHGVETDTFSNATMTSYLYGLPHRFTVELTCAGTGDCSGAPGEPNGPTGIGVSGVSERIPMPDRSLLVTAGRFVNFSPQAFSMVPDFGNKGDMAALCAALAP